MLRGDDEAIVRWKSPAVHSYPVQMAAVEAPLRCSTSNPLAFKFQKHRYPNNVQAQSLIKLVNLARINFGKMPTSTSDADIIFNRANIALAKSQRLIASWLPPRTEEELRSAKSVEEIEREEEEMFKPMPELYDTL